jgi:putative acetyltransferase
VCAGCFLGVARAVPGRGRIRRIPPGAGGRRLESTGSVRPVEVTIRAYERRDAADVADVFYRSVREVALSDYTAEQVTAWVPGRWDAEQEHRRSGDGRLVLVAADESGHVVAFIDLEPDGHIDRLFCAPEAAGRGIASRLYEAVETAARAQGIERLFTEASELARRFFERKGFTVLQRQDKILRGVPIHNYQMAKTLG